ncbi:subtilisin-like protease SBT5.4 [Cucurbita moschata]|uniref:Subtilisin-like protease SBT5.4 n=1 Tax=Cucurbita moschata TaxID=3662 RepID=A0A6J1EMX6_CUCMO|nr:subtilisin-like protease SBT5.4 [Cucurbita moschata]
MLYKRETLDHSKVKGKILVCLRGGSSRIDKEMQVVLAGAVKMILCNDRLSGFEIIADFHVLLASRINYNEGQPDVTASGVNIIMAFFDVVSPTREPFDNRIVSYITMSGTSMSCRHVSGIVGLLKALHPEWSPATIKSAIMTSTRISDNTMNLMLDDGSPIFAPATPFIYGSGHIRPTSAIHPGLVYDLSPNNYLEFLCASGYKEKNIRVFADGSILNFNYPSIGVQNLIGSVTKRFEV